MNRFLPTRFARASVGYVIGVVLVVFGYANIGLIMDDYLLAVLGAVVFGVILAVYLGYASGSTWSVLLLGFGILIAELPDTPLAQGGVYYGEGVIQSLPHFWVPCTFFAFLPAWAIGRYIGYVVDRSLENESPSPEH